MLVVARSRQVKSSRPLKGILRELAQALKDRYGEKFVGLWLYGSQARGQAHDQSDVDLLLLLRGEVRPSKEIDRIADLLADFNLRYGELLSVLPVHERTFKNSDGPFWRNVRREGKAA